MFLCNCPVGNCLVGSCFVGDCPVGNCPVGSYPVGSCPGRHLSVGNCPDTKGHSLHISGFGSAVKLYFLSGFVNSQYHGFVVFSMANTKSTVFAKPWQTTGFLFCLSLKQSACSLLVFV